MTVQTDDGYVYPAWSFGDRIRKARDIAGMNQRDFAAAIDAKEGSLAAWETDRAKPRDIVAVSRRVEILTRIPAAWLLGVDDASGGKGPDGGGVRPKGFEPLTFCAITGTDENGQVIEVDFRTDHHPDDEDKVA